MPIKAVIDTPTLQVIEPAPTVSITVASGLDGRRGSYIFTALFTDPNDATSYDEITQSAAIRLLEYDYYVSATDGSQWQYRYNGSGVLQWLFITSGGGGGAGVSVLKDVFTIPSTHATSYDLVHNRNTRDVNVFVYRDVAPYVSVDCYVDRVSLNKLTLKFLNAELTPTQLKAVVISYI